MAGPPRFLERLLFGIFALLLSALTPSPAAPIPISMATDQARAWMAGHPLLGSRANSIQSAEPFPGGEAPYSVYVIRLAPTGYLILNSDDRLPLVVAFSDQSQLSLDAVDENSFRAFIENHLVQALDQLARPAASGAISTMGDFEPMDAGGDEFIAPLLETTWNQCHPYNILAPADPGGTEYYGYRAPSGCVPTAYAQILHYHRWPVRGKGSHQYTDNSGSITGSHTADFSDTYEWSEMQPTYDAYGTNPQAAEYAVGELMYELGVAAGADYERSGTSSNTSVLASKLTKHFYFGNASVKSTQSTLLPALEADLRAGYPSVVSIPGHAVVADGLLTHSGTTTYHINYGWGGTNNGWWAANAVPGGGITDGINSLIPSLIPFPVQSTLTVEAGNPLELQWILPKRRDQQADKLNLYRRETMAAPWSSDASTLGRAITSNWSVVSGGKVGTCWFAGPNGPAVFDFDETFVPQASTNLVFWQQHRLGTATFTISLSTDDGQTYTPIFSLKNNFNLSWQQQTISLAAYAGATVRLRMELSSGSYYTGGGVWVDEMSVTSGTWASWTPFSANLPLGSRRFSSTNTPWDEAVDHTHFSKTSTSTFEDWEVTTLATGETCFYKPPGGYSNHQYHLTANTPITPTANTRLRLRTKFNLATDSFRVLVSTNGSTYTPIWTTQASSDWADIAIGIGDYAGQAIRVRLEYGTGSYYIEGGIWIDSVSTEEVTNPELEGQPLHFATLDTITPGTYELAGAIVDKNQVEHAIAPSFTLQVNPSSAHQVTFVPGLHGDRTGGGALVQNVPHGAAASAPAITPHPGWLFSGWNAPFASVTENLEIAALYSAKLASAGTPHWWLIEKGVVASDAPDATFDAAEAMDLAGKGFSLHDEFLFGTDPNDPASRFDVGIQPLPSNQVSLQWTGKAGRTYRVLRSTTLTAGSWEEVSTAVCTTDGLPMSYSGSPSGGGRTFYRLSVHLSP